MEEQAKVEAGKKKIEWGSQIRSYVFDDRRVKDVYKRQPLDGIIRELKEEFEHKKSSKVHFSSITYLGSEYRADYDRCH